MSTLQGIRSSLVAALAAYAAAPEDAGYSTQNVQLASSYEEVEKASTPGRYIYGWLGTATRVDVADSGRTMLLEVPMYVRVRAIGMEDEVEHLALGMIEDVMKALLADDETYNAVRRSTLIQLGTEIIIRSGSADALVDARVRFKIRGA